jgi:hypothetical protein
MNPLALIRRFTNCVAYGCVPPTTSRLWSIARILAMTCAAAFLMTQPVSAQTAHSATLSWAAPSDAVASSTYNIYRAAGACPLSGLGTLTFSKLNTAPITALTYTDTTVGVGSWCYYGTQVQNGVESVPSNTAGGNVVPNGITIQLILK